MKLDWTGSQTHHPDNEGVASQSRFWRGVASVSIRQRICVGRRTSLLPSNSSTSSQLMRRSTWKNGPKKQLQCKPGWPLTSLTDNQDDITKYWDPFLILMKYLQINDKLYFFFYLSLLFLCVHLFWCTKHHRMLFKMTMSCQSKNIKEYIKPGLNNHALWSAFMLLQSNCAQSLLAWYIKTFSYRHHKPTQSVCHIPSFPFNSFTSSRP